jgi:hypothetical protein
MSTVVKMLERSMDTPPPPFPFEQLVSPTPTLNLHNGTHEDSDTSSSWTNTLEKSNSNPVHNALEIELAT